MRIVATRRPQDMTAEERRTVLGYSGWGGLSIEAVMDQFPPGLVPDDFALAHEFFTPPPVAGEISDIVCRYLPELAGFDGIVRALEPSVGIGRLIHPMGPPRCLVTDPRYKGDAVDRGRAVRGQRQDVRGHAPPTLNCTRCRSSAGCRSMRRATRGG
jgi:hypothetical protein